MLSSAVVAGPARLIDYAITPRRFRPGFERHLGRASMAAVYTAFGLGLFAGAWLRHRRRR